MQNFTCAVCHVFHQGKWNELKSYIACVTLHFKTRLTIYCLPLYVKMGASYKRRTKQWEMEHFCSSFISRYMLDAPWNGEWHRLVRFFVSFHFPPVKTHRFNTFSEIYRSPLYIKAFSSYKRRTKHVENRTLSSLISQERFHVRRRPIYSWKGIEMASYIS